jgi:hypothetical protein
MCGLFLEEPGDGQGKITLFFEASVKAETRHQFETFIENHLKRRAIRDSIRRRPIISCTSCGFTVTEQMIELFMQINTVVFPCPICQAAGRNTHISLRDPRLDDSSRAQKVILDMDQAADAERQRATAIATLQGKQATGDYDLFLWFHRTDRAFAQNIGTALEQHGILAWLQEWSGERDQPVWSALQSSLPKIKKVGFVMGRDSLSSWRHPDVPTLLRIFRDRQIAVLPILLPNFPQDVEPPPFLQGMGRVDFRVRDPNPLRQLLRGITGKTGLTPDTQLSLSQLTHRLSLYRTQLGHYLNQLAITGSAHVTPEVTAGIREARSEIARIKAHLRTQGATVTDLPDDFD